jgi:TPP-dependent pyruvate/acetoin dehydrogenase alpha subunit
MTTWFEDDIFYFPAHWPIHLPSQFGDPVLTQINSLSIFGFRTTSDDAKRYRNEADVVEWAKKDPITRFERYLTEKKIINPVLIGKIKAESEQQIERAVKTAESAKPQTPTEMFDYLYENLTEEMKEQKEQSAKENKIITKTTSGENAAKNGGVVGELEEA